MNEHKFKALEHVVGILEMYEIPVEGVHVSNLPDVPHRIVVNGKVEILFPVNEPIGYNHAQVHLVGKGVIPVEIEDADKPHQALIVMVNQALALVAAEAALDEQPAHFVNYYDCDNCGHSWEDEWSCQCNDKCPECNREIQPSASKEI